MTIVASDNFNRADAIATGPGNGLIGQTTPVGAKTWLSLNGSGLWSVSSQKAICNAAPNKAGIDTALADGWVQCDYNPGGTPADGGLILRWANTNNFMAFIVDPGGYYLQKFVSGVGTNVAHAGSPGSGLVTLKVTMSGSTITCFANGTQLFQATVSDAALLSNTKHGLASSSAHATETWDNFSVDDGVTITPVNANPATLKWDLLATVDSTPATLKWNLRAAVDAIARSLIWNLRATLDATPATVKWDLRGAVDANPRTLNWNLAAQTSAATATLIWNLAAITDANPAILKWDLYTQVNATRGIIWNLHAKSNRWPEQNGNDWPANTGDNWPQATTTQRWPARS